MDLKLRSLALSYPRVRRRLLDLRAVLAAEGPLGGAGLEVHHERPTPDGQALLLPDAGLRPPLGRKLHVPEPLVWFFVVVVGVGVGFVDGSGDGGGSSGGGSSGRCRTQCWETQPREEDGQTDRRGDGVENVERSGVLVRGYAELELGTAQATCGVACTASSMHEQLKIPLFTQTLRARCGTARPVQPQNQFHSRLLLHRRRKH